MEELLKLIEQLENSVTEIENRSKTLNKQHSTIDQELCDIYHYIENSNLDAYHGYLAYKELRDCLKRRREIKDQVDIITSVKGNQITSKNIKKIKDVVKNKSDRKYRPRVRKELFQ